MAHPGSDKEKRQTVTSRRSLSPTKRAQLFQAASGVCHICEQKIQIGQAWDAEHKIPLALGGADDESNMAPAHKVCHAPKTVEDVVTIARAKRRALKHIGIKKRSSFPCGKDTPWKRTVGGRTVPR